MPGRGKVGARRTVQSCPPPFREFPVFPHFCPPVCRNFILTLHPSYQVQAKSCGNVRRSSTNNKNHQLRLSLPGSPSTPNLLAPIPTSSPVYFHDVCTPPPMPTPSVASHHVRYTLHLNSKTPTRGVTIAPDPLGRTFSSCHSSKTGPSSPSDSSLVTSRPVMQPQGIGMGICMHPPCKSGLVFDNNLTHLQDELQKDRVTGAELHSLNLMDGIHGTLGGILVSSFLVSPRWSKSLTPFPAYQ